MELDGGDHLTYAFRTPKDTYSLILEFWEWEDRVLWPEIYKLYEN